MSETIKLKVPAEPESETVSQGNFHADLVPNSTIEVTNRRFADWLIFRHGLTEIKPKTKTAKPAEENPFAASYPADFPGRDALVTAQIPFETTQGLTKEQLLKVPNIGDQTADQILGYTPTLSPSRPVVDDTAATGDNNASDDNATGDNSNDGGAA